jgi:hypothetical protein
VENLVRYIAENGDETVFESSPTAYLVLLVNGRSSQTFPLRGEIQMGRDKTNGVVVADTKVSRHHAHLTPIDESFILTDLGSANGTYLNGVLISQPTRLKPHDHITLGDTAFLFTETPVLEPDVIKAIANNPARASRAIQPTSSNQAGGHLGLETTPLWIAMGCMAVIIIGLLLVLAVLVGLMIGRGQADLGILNNIAGLPPNWVWQG